MKKYIIALLILLQAAGSMAQIRFDLAGSAGVNYLRTEDSEHFKDQDAPSKGCYLIDLSVHTDKQRRFNLGAGISLTSVHFQVNTTTYSLPYYTSYYGSDYRFKYVSIYPMIDFGIGKKRLFIGRLSAPMSFKLSASESWNAHIGYNNTDTSGTDNSGFRQFVPRLSVAFIANIPMPEKRVFLTINASYTGALLDFKDGIRPSQLLFGLGLGYKSARHTPKTLKK